MPSNQDDTAVRRDVMVTPQDDRKGPGVLILHSGRGLTPYIESLCHRLAHRGYVGYALDLFEGATPTSVSESTAIKSQFPPASTLDRIEDGISFLTSFRGSSRPQIGVLGVGYGGDLALQLLDRNPGDVRTVVVYYGYHDIDWRNLPAHFLGNYADRDPEIPRADLQSAMEVAAHSPQRSEFKVYAGTDPSFFEDEDTAKFDPDAAQDSWNRTLSFF